MTAFQDGYLTEIAYPHHVHPELSPGWLAAVLQALGQRAPRLDQRFRYCELGCGQGLNIALLAAANPAGQFLGVDFNARHIEHGRQLASSAQLNNLTYQQASFAEAGDEEGEGFDFIVLHGVYSWVSADNRAAIRRFIDKRLKPGGVLYLAYMSHPGMSAFVSAQRFLWQTAQGLVGTPQQRLRGALDALGQWQAAGAGYFIEHPDVAKRLARADEEDLAFLAHELLCEHWTPLHAADVIASLGEIGCQFLGSATPVENIDALSLPGNCQALLAGLSEPQQRETAKDMARNQSQRRDLYQRAPRPLSADEHRQALLDGCWSALPAAPSSGAVSFDTRIGAVQGEEGLFSPLLCALAEGPQRFIELARRRELAGQLGELSPALQLLLGAGMALPLLEGEIAVEHCQAFNRVLAEGALQGAGYRHLLAPSLGAPIPASLEEMAAARALLEHPQLRGELLCETALALLRRTGHAAGEAQIAALRGVAENTLKHWLQLGVVSA